MTNNFAPSMEVAIGAAPVVKARQTIGPDELAFIRRTAARYLPYWAAEDCVSNMIERELKEAASVKRPGLVRTERFTATYIRLECRTWALRVERKRMAELEETRDSAPAPDLEDEDIQERPADADEPEPAPVPGAWATWEAAVSLAAELGVSDIPGAYELLASGLSDLDAKDLAARLGLGADAFKMRAHRARKAIQLRCDPAAILEAMPTGAAWRDTPSRPPATWSIGREDSKQPDSKAPASVLLSRGPSGTSSLMLTNGDRKASAAGLDHSARPYYRAGLPAPAPDAAPVTERRTDVLIPAEWGRIVRSFLRPDEPTSGPRPHRAHADIPAEHSGISAHPDPDLSARATGLGFIRRTRPPGGGHYRPRYYIRRDHSNVRGLMPYSK